MIKVKRLLFCLILIFGIVTGSFIDDTPVRADNRVSTVYNGVDYSPVYDFDYYVSKYEDVRRVFNGDPTKTFWHFINYGMREGRQAKADFNVGAYKNRYTDLQIAYGNNITASGEKEKEEVALNLITARCLMHTIMLTDTQI